MTRQKGSGRRGCLLSNSITVDLIRHIHQEERFVTITFLKLMLYVIGLLFKKYCIAK